MPLYFVSPTALPSHVFYDVNNYQSFGTMQSSATSSGQGKQAKRSQKSDEKLHRKFEGSLNKSTGGQKQRKETRKLTELKNPSDMTVDTRAEQALGLHKRARDEPPDELPTQGGQLVPLRAHHSRE